MDKKFNFELVFGIAVFVTAIIFGVSLSVLWPPQAMASPVEASMQSFPVANMKDTTSTRQLLEDHGKSDFVENCQLSKGIASVRLWYGDEDPTAKVLPAQMLVFCVIIKKA